VAVKHLKDPNHLSCLPLLIKSSEESQPHAISFIRSHVLTFHINGTLYIQ